MLYTTLILPIFDYGDIIYNCLSQQNAVMLQRLQDMSLRTILQTDKRASTVTIHENLDVLALESRRNMHSATQMYKINNGIAPEPVVKLFVRRDNINPRATRCTTQNRYDIPYCRLQMSRRDFVYRGINIWHGLPTAFQSIDTLKEFKSTVHMWLLDGDVGIT